MKERNYGIDALRMLSMFMVAVLHTLGQGGLLNASAGHPVQNHTAWLLELAAFCAVNCYALISGYVGVDSRYRYTNLALIWLRVLYYSVLIWLLYFVLYPAAFSPETLLDAFFPVYGRTYWYVSAYFGLFLLIPLLNRGIRALNRKQAIFLCAGLFALLSVGTFLSGDPFSLGSGYSFIWLTVLYVFGACIRRFGLFSGLRRRTALLGYLFAVFVSWGIRFLCAKKVLPSLLGQLKPAQYTSPFILASGVFLLLLFSGLSFGNFAKKCIRFFSPLAFSVYLIHVHPVVWKLILKNRFVRFGGAHPLLFPLIVLVLAFSVYLVCSLADIPREWLFGKLRLKERLNALEDRFLKGVWEEK